MKVFIAGSSGLVGASLVRNAPRGFQLLTPSSTELNLLNKEQVHEFLTYHKPDAVLLAAAKVGGISANSRHRREFLTKNLQIQDSVIDSSRVLGVKSLIFLGSSCIYPRLATQPIKEQSLLTGPLESTNEGYAIAKIAGLKLCEAIAREDSLNYFSVMPTNLYGPNDNFHPENSHVPAALMRRFHEAKLEDLEEVRVWGTGTPFREFMHVDDLAEACWFLLRKKLGGKLINVGTGEGMSIAEFAKLMAKTVGYGGRITFDTSRPDGTPKKILDVSKVHALGWHHRISLPVGLDSTYRWFLQAWERGEVREH